MAEVRLRPMSAGEFEVWRPWVVEEYAREDVEHKEVDPERALDNMSAFLDSTLPRGPRTPGQQLSIVEDAVTGQRVGYTWWGTREVDAGDVAWIYDVWIDEEHRGRGFGRSLMRALEREALDRGLDRLELHVWAGNERARSLYRSLGFREIGLEMFKPLA